MAESDTVHEVPYKAMSVGQSDAEANASASEFLSDQKQWVLDLYSASYWFRLYAKRACLPVISLAALTAAIVDHNDVSFMVITPVEAFVLSTLTCFFLRGCMLNLSPLDVGLMSAPVTEALMSNSEFRDTLQDTFENVTENLKEMRRCKKIINAVFGLLTTLGVWAIAHTVHMQLSGDDNLDQHDVVFAGVAAAATTLPSLAFWRTLKKAERVIGSTASSATDANV